METVTYKTQAVKTLAPEDVQVGEYVAVTSETVEFPAHLLDCGFQSQSEPVRMRFLPYRNVGDPLKVLAVCLPFVVVKKVEQKSATKLDLRQCALARLGKDYVKAVRKSKRTKVKTKKKRKSKKEA